MAEMIRFVLVILGYPIILVGALVLLGLLSRTCRSQTYIDALARPRNAAFILGLATVGLLWLLAHSWTPDRNSWQDIAAGIAYVACFGTGCYEIYRQRKPLLDWLGYQTQLVRPCRCGGGCRCKDSCKCDQTGT